MIIRHFRTNYSIITSLIWVLVLFIIRSQLAYSEFDVNANHLSSDFIQQLTNNKTMEIFSLFLAVSLISFSSYLFNNKYIIDQYRSFLPILLSVLMLCSGNSIFLLSSAHIGLLFILLSFLSILNIENANKAQNNITNAALILSIGSILDPKLLYFIPLLWIGTSIFKRLTIRTFLASLIGTLSPYIILAGLVYLFGDTTEWVQKFNVQFHFFEYGWDGLNQGFIVFLSMILLILLFVFFTLQKKTDRLKTYSRKVIGIVILFFLIVVILFSLGMIGFKTAYIYAVFPLSILFSMHLNHTRPRTANILILLLVLGSLIGFISEF